MAKKLKKIAFQGAKGAYSDLACRTVFPELETVPCHSFDDAFLAAQSGETDLAMIPIDNSIAGRVADVHHLLPDSGLFIIGEHFQAVHHNLLGVKGAKKKDLKHVHSHVHAIPQCKKLIQSLGLKAHVHADTAGAAEEVANRGDKEHAAIASSLAADIYGLEILEKDIQDKDHNTTRFLILSRDPQVPDIDRDLDVLTSIIFKVRHIPASLYKSLGGFATNGFNMTKLESYEGPNFQRAQFYCEVEGHAESKNFGLALEELNFYANDVRILGTYPAHPFRRTYKKRSHES